MSIRFLRHVRIPRLTASLALLLALVSGLSPAAARTGSAAIGDPVSVVISSSPAVDPASPSRSAVIHTVAESVASGPLSPLNLLAVAVAACVTVIGLRLAHDRSRGVTPAPPSIDPPGDLPPAVAGALALGFIHDNQIAATILDLARRGALTIEPETNLDIRIRLLDESVLQAEFERQTWVVLKARANERGVIASKRLTRIYRHWKPAKVALRQDLQARGWFARDAAERRRPAVFAGVIALLLAAVAFVLAIQARESWALLGFGLLSAAGLGSFLNGAIETTSDGEHHAVPWRAYLSGLQGAKSNMDLDLDQALPYALAMCVESTLNGALKTASEQGYQPPWLGVQRSEIMRNAGFIRFYSVFHLQTTPPKRYSS